MKRTFSLLTIILMLTGCMQDTPKPAPEPAQDRTPAAPKTSAAVPDFDGKRAYDYLLAQTNFGPRNPGSAGHRNCLDYLRTELERYADAVNLQPFAVTGYKGEQVRMTNVIASFNASAPTRILLLAHWDTRPWADQESDPVKAEKPVLGANDGASGVAVLLEIARHLKASPPAVGVDILLTDGEDFAVEGNKEEYLRGSKYFAANLPQGFRPVFGILLDMVGDKELELMKERHSVSFAPDVVELVWNAAKELHVTQFSDKLQGFVTDDHLPLNRAGIRTIDLIDFDYPNEGNSYWHTLKDTPDKCSAESLEAVGKVVLHVIYTHGA